MKRISVPALLVLAAFVLGACDDPPPRRERPGYRPPPPPPKQRIIEREPDIDEPSTDSTEPVDVRNTPPPAPTDVPVGSPEYGKPVNGKPGFVTSPYAPTAGYVDVRGFPPGTEVKDPYTGKIFLVP